MTSAQDQRHAQGGGYPPEATDHPVVKVQAVMDRPAVRGPEATVPQVVKAPEATVPQVVKAPEATVPQVVKAPEATVRPRHLVRPEATVRPVRRTARRSAYNPGAPYGPPGTPPPGADVKKRAQTWLIVSAASFFFCACGFSIIGAVFCFMAMQAADQGNLADAENKLKWGKIITMSGFALGLVMSVIGSIVYATQIFAAIASH